MICTCSLVLLLASGCSTEKANEWFVTHNGNMPTNERISRIEVGDSKEGCSSDFGLAVFSRFF